jgi:hydrogenase maturation protein HypF
MRSARSIQIRGVVQGVGFRPFVYRLACARSLGGWIFNNHEGVEIFAEGMENDLDEFVQSLRVSPPPAAVIARMEVRPTEPQGLHAFVIRESDRQELPSARISPDLPVCDECLRELFDRSDRRYGYPYINCTNCGPRYSVVQRLPYDRQNTTMAAWALDPYCEEQYRDPGNRRFHAQPVACAGCGPGYYLSWPERPETDRGDNAIARAAQLLREGRIVAVKGLGGYHLACDAANETAVGQLRQRKFRKEKPFALMVPNLAIAEQLAHLNSASIELLASAARPIVLARSKVGFAGVAPENDDLGIMLPYTPLHHLLFAAGAPEVLVMTSANRSSEPIAYEDDEALQHLTGIADAFLVGERPIARRIEDSIARQGVLGPVILRRARGYAPGAVAVFPVDQPVLALGADLKNTITLVVGGQAFGSQHIGDLEHYQSFHAFEQTIDDLLAMYELKPDRLVITHDAHPEYRSTIFAQGIAAAQRLPVQHHRAHVASVLAERGEWERRVIGVSLDGTGYGDDGAIWGCEFFAGSLCGGFERVAHLLPACLPGGDSAARFPVQAAAGFLAGLGDLPDFWAAPFHFPARFADAAQLVRKNVRTFPTTSAGRLFDTAAALLGFTRQTSFEGQPAIWLEHLARRAEKAEPYAFPFAADILDFRPALRAMIRDRLQGRAISQIARAFQCGLAHGVSRACVDLADRYRADTVVFSGGVFQNEMLLTDLKLVMFGSGLQLWTNHVVPPNDGGISLGQAAVAATKFVGGDASQAISG